jgi:NhaA family Na+:H+ antiporter
MSFPIRPRTQARILARGSRREFRRIAGVLRTETVGGLLLMAAALLAMIWANSPWSQAYFVVRDTSVGYEPLHLRLTVGHWAADGLLAVFFFLVGLELKHEFVAGDLRDPAKAVVPVTAAVAGVAVPAGIYLAVNAGAPGAAGWAIPAATDIAFALAVLAIIASHLPAALRVFLLTLAVVDDLIAILIIAIAYTADISVGPLLTAVLPLALFAFLVQRHPTWFASRTWAMWAILLPIGFVAWAFVHASGIHATIAGVVLGLTVPVLRSRAEDSRIQPLEKVMEHQIRPFSAGFAVPVFALFSAGVSIGGGDALWGALTDPVTIGGVLGLVAGKPLGIVGGTWLVTRFTRAELDESVAWADIVGVGLLAGIGFTVSLLVAELSFPNQPLVTDHAKLGVLAASLMASLLAAVVLTVRNRRYRALEEEAVLSSAS